MLPLRYGSPTEYAALRAYLTKCGYTGRELCARFGIRSMYAFRTEAEGGVRSTEVLDRVDLLVRLFLDGSFIAEEVAAPLLGEEGLRSLHAFGLLERHARDENLLAGSVLLYPTEELYIVSDVGITRNVGPESHAIGSPLMRPDAVYPAITGSTRAFVRSLPAEPRGHFLELCGGTGIAALMAARTAQHAWSVDITERSTRFAEFNARLNDLSNFTALQGNLYEPVRDLTFDYIAAHPPYVPAAGTGLIYAEGGRDGEELTCAMIAGLERHLRPGGAFYCTCVATDRTGAPLELRVRSLLGARDEEFDVLVLEKESYSAREFVMSRAAAASLSPEQVRQQHALYRELGVERALFCAIVVQRHERPQARPCFTVRRRTGDRATSPVIEWLLRWSALRSTPDYAERVLRGRPRILPHVRLRTTHRATAGGWEAEQCQLSTDVPVPSAIDISANAALLVAACDGTLTVRQLFAQLKNGGALPAEMPESAFVEFVTQLASEGMIELDGLLGEQHDSLAPERDGDRRAGLEV